MRKGIKAQAYRDCAAQGMTKMECAKALGVTSSMVSRASKTLNLTFLPKNHATIVAITTMAAKGMRKKDIAAELGLCKSTVFRSVMLNGIKFKKNKSRRKLSPPQLLLGIEDNVWDWLVNQIPEGGSIRDLVIAIVKDAYYEDQLPCEGNDNG